MRNGGGGAQIGKRRLFYTEESGSPEIVISTGGKKRIDHTVQKR